MDQDASDARAERFSAYIDDLASVLGDPRRHGPMTSYCTGLLMPVDRKSVEPMAAVTAPDRTAAQHQSLLHFVGQGKWSDEKVTEPEAPTLRPERHVAAVVKSRRGS